MRRTIPGQGGFDLRGALWHSLEGVGVLIGETATRLRSLEPTRLRVRICAREAVWFAWWAEPTLRGGKPRPRKRLSSEFVWVVQRLVVDFEVAVFQEG